MGKGFQCNKFGCQDSYHERVPIIFEGVGNVAMTVPKVLLQSLSGCQLFKKLPTFF